MGTFLGHLVPGLALALLGFWHAISTIRSNYHNGTTKFRSRFWYPFKSTPLPTLQYIDLILVLSFSVFCIVIQFIDLPSLHLSFKLHNIEHATMFLHLTVFAGFTLLAEISNLHEILHGILGILATSIFGQELFLLHYHSTDHVGLEGHYHWLLQLVVCISLISALVVTCFPSCFPAALVLSISVIFQGVWFMNMGFSLWFPHFVPQGCVMQSSEGHESSSVHGAIMCQTDEADSRARAMANLQFSWVIAAILIIVSGISLMFARNRADRTLLSKYEQLQNRGRDTPVTINCLK
ncbi:uncharacterized protein LOC125838977 [Solanum verrucosum]|uniref:uncharacterized protein LOC125838977 n=1 Tax=Solanum verrucosum TaxID=315347 RepID=UPI0020D03CF9|nr:uncharacterized protein LOC125838977 [Solanum verrucosum]